MGVEGVEDPGGALLRGADQPPPGEFLSRHIDRLLRADAERMLVIGAQENLQRQDLDPIEEAQIIAWHERVFSDKNQAEIGAMLGKSSDWVSVRARIHKLPDELKDRLRERPRAIGQMLELASLYTQQPKLAVTLADRVVRENLTVEAIRAIVRTQRQAGRKRVGREEEHNRRVGATSPRCCSTTTAGSTSPAPRPAAAREPTTPSLSTASCRARST